LLALWPVNFLREVSNQQSNLMNGVASAYFRPFCEHVPVRVMYTRVDFNATDYSGEMRLIKKNVRRYVI
jgi:hypothetical protein